VDDVAVSLTDGGGRCSTTASGAAVDPTALVADTRVTDQRPQTRMSPCERGLCARGRLLL
jgi:hypothetical protein